MNKTIPAQVLPHLDAVLPPKAHIFRAFDLCPSPSVVIQRQDPTTQNDSKAASKNEFQGATWNAVLATYGNRPATVSCWHHKVSACRPLLSLA